jgi:phosphoribosylcarboxyaminoimidazole (NCAIR) mutase
VSGPLVAIIMGSKSDLETLAPARELLAELARVEDTQRRLSALAAEADRASSYRAQRPLRQREHAIVDELTARRHRRGLIAAPLAQERPADRTPPPWA